MKIRNALLLLSFFFLTAVLLPQTAKSVEGTGLQAPIIMPAKDLKWMDLDPTGAPGVKVANLWGDYKTGSFGAIFRLPAGFTAPLHTHTHDMKVVTISGTYLQTPEGKPEFRLEPGSYFMQPGGNYRHITRCDAAADCVFFVESDGPFDLHPVETPK
jgi:hypothetical protein